MSRYVCVCVKYKRERELVSDSKREKERARARNIRERERAHAMSRVLSSGKEVPTKRRKKYRCSYWGKESMLMGAATGAKSVHNSRVYTILLQHETREERALAFCRLVSP